MPRPRWTALSQALLVLIPTLPRPPLASRRARRRAPSGARTTLLTMSPLRSITLRSKTSTPATASSLSPSRWLRPTGRSPRARSSAAAARTSTRRSTRLRSGRTST
eukprot:Amastigsp_a510112_13.p3 type:complete len:106 gc:universal Amastigsp_a510112_13:481-798(+)